MHQSVVDVEERRRGQIGRRGGRCAGLAQVGDGRAGACLACEPLIIGVSTQNGSAGSMTSESDTNSA